MPASPSSGGFVEIYNASPETADITECRLLNSAPGVEDFAGVGFALLSGQFFLIDYDWGASADYLPDDPNVWPPDGQVYLECRDSFGAPHVVDALGFGDFSGFETPGPPPPPLGSSFERKNDMFSTAVTLASGGAAELDGNHFDTDNNANDFVIHSAPFPQISFFIE